jgi:hypothetical protein
MVCQICGWQMRISDPSLSPDNYHARCGGAGARSNNERGLVRRAASGKSANSERPAKKRHPFQLGTFLARCLKIIGVKQKSGCGCGRREATLNCWGRHLLGALCCRSRS